MKEQTVSKVPEIRFREFKDDWQEKALGELFPITSAARVHKNEWCQSGVPFFRSSDVVSSFKGNENKKAFISHELYEELSAKVGRVKSGDMLVTGGGSIGIPYLVKTDEPLYFKDADLLWFKIREAVDSNFIYTFFCSRPFRRYLKSISHIGTIAHYTVEQAKGTPVTLPRDSSEQTQIGRYFRELDSLIGLHQRKHDKLVTLKKAMLQKMFPQSGTTTPKIRFKGFSEEWVEEKLGKLGAFSKGQGYSKSDLATSGTPIVLYGRLYVNYQTAISGVDTFVVEKKGSVKSAGKEVIVPASGETAEDIARASAIVTKGIILGGDLNIIFPFDELDSYFLALTLSNGKPQTDLARRAQGKTVVHVRKADLESVLIPFPKLAEQQKIGNYFRTLDSLISKHAIHLQKLQQIKSACLEKMFV